MPEFPTGTVTFSFTDLAGSTRLWEHDREAMAALQNADAVGYLRPQAQLVLGAG